MPPVSIDTPRRALMPIYADNKSVNKRARKLGKPVKSWRAECDAAAADLHRLMLSLGAQCPPEGEHGDYVVTLATGSRWEVSQVAYDSGIITTRFDSGADAAAAGCRNYYGEARPKWNQLHDDPAKNVDAVRGAVERIMKAGLA